MEKNYVVDLSLIQDDYYGVNITPKEKEIIALNGLSEMKKVTFPDGSVKECKLLLTENSNGTEVNIGFIEKVNEKTFTIENLNYIPSDDEVKILEKNLYSSVIEIEGKTYLVKFDNELNRSIALDSNFVGVPLEYGNYKLNDKELLMFANNEPLPLHAYIIKDAKDNDIHVIANIKKEGDNIQIQNVKEISKSEYKQHQLTLNNIGDSSQSQYQRMLNAELSEVLNKTGYENNITLHNNAKSNNLYKGLTDEQIIVATNLIKEGAAIDNKTIMMVEYHVATIRYDNNIDKDKNPQNKNKTELLINEFSTTANAAYLKDNSKLPFVSNSKAIFESKKETTINGNTGESSTSQYINLSSNDIKYTQHFSQADWHVMNIMQNKDFTKELMIYVSESGYKPSKPFSEFTHNTNSITEDRKSMLQAITKVGNQPKEDVKQAPPGTKRKIAAEAAHSANQIFKIE